MKLQDTSREIHEIIPDFLYLTKNREAFIFVKPADERKDAGNTIVLEQQSGVTRKFEVIRTVPLLKIVRVIKTALHNKVRSRRGGSPRALKCMQI